MNDKPVAIRIKNSKNVHIYDNHVTGMELLDGENVEDLYASGNVVEDLKSADDPQIEKSWFKRFRIAELSTVLGIFASFIAILSYFGIKLID